MWSPQFPISTHILVYVIKLESFNHIIILDHFGYPLYKRVSIITPKTDQSDTYNSLLSNLSKGYRKIQSRLLLTIKHKYKYVKTL